MIKHGLLAETPAPQEYIGLGWRQHEAGVRIVLRITDAGRRAIGADGTTTAAEPSTETMPAIPRSELPAAAASGPVGGNTAAKPQKPLAPPPRASARHRHG
jgi:hypothetical protein